MKTKFNEKLNIRKKDNLIELEIENMSLLDTINDLTQGAVVLNSYSIYLNKRSAKLLIQKLQKLIE